MTGSGRDCARRHVDVAPQVVRSRTGTAARADPDSTLRLAVLRSRLLHRFAEHFTMRVLFPSHVPNAVALAAARAVALVTMNRPFNA
jgi:hypothetical protein